MICIRLLTAFAILLVSASAGAQDKPVGGGDQSANRSADKGAILDKRSKQGQGSEDQDSEKEGLSKEKGGLVDADALGKGDNMVVNHGARGFCRLDASVRPKRLLPGQTGTLLVTMVLEGDSVLTAPANVLVSSAGGSLTVGPAAVRPATRGTVAKAYLGQPVYDNFAIVEMPVTMSPTAALGSKQHAALDFDFELFQGATGKLLGQFKERVSVVCEVGGVLDPVVHGGSSKEVNPAPQAQAVRSEALTPVPGASVPAELQPATEPVPKAAPMDGPVSSTVPPGEADPVSDDSLPVESESSTPLWLGGIAAGLAIVLGILLRRR